MIIRPNSEAVLYAAGGKFEPKATNFPCCKLFFKCDETSGSVMTDSITGETYTLTGSISRTLNGITVPSATHAAKTLVTPIAVGNKTALLLAVGNINDFAGITLDNGSTSVISVSVFTGNRVTDGTNTSNGGNATVATEEGTAVLYVPGTTNEGQKLESTLAAYTATAAVSATPGDLTTMPTMTRMQIGSAASALRLNLLAFFVFANGAPVNLRSAIACMTADALAGNKRIYSGFKGIA